MISHYRIVLVAAAGLLGCAMLGCSSRARVDQKLEKFDGARLAVVVVFDQLRADYLTKWESLYDKDGFGRLLKDGAWFQNCRYPYANSVTVVGHASMSTGCLPNKHGIIANNWYGRESAAMVNAVFTERYPLAPLLGKTKRGASPQRLRRETVGDALLKQTRHKGKVVSISIKDRAAIVLAGLLRGLALWFDTPNGMWVTSTYYRDAPPSWVTKYNKERRADRWFGKNWNRLRGNLDYVKYSGVDDFPYEGVGFKQGKTFPHPTTGGLKKPGKEYYYAMAFSPFGNDMTLEMAKRAIDEEQLGKDDIPDLLCVSFASNDYVGHCWGPDSQEVLDITLRSDLLVKDLLAHLDQRVGKGKYVVVVCSDHGVCPLPEYLHAHGDKKGGRLAPGPLKTKALAHLNKQFGKGKQYNWFAEEASGMVYFNRKLIRSKKIKQSEMEDSLAKWFVDQPAIAAAYTRTQLMQGKIKKDDHLGQMVLQSFDPAASGDVMAVLAPYYLLSNPLSLKDTGTYTTTHGSPHDYDTHVPLLVFGANVTKGIRKDRVTPLAVAPIAAQVLGIRPPAGATAGVPKGLVGH